MDAQGLQKYPNYADIALLLIFFFFFFLVERGKTRAAGIVENVNVSG